MTLAAASDSRESSPRDSHASHRHRQALRSVTQFEVAQYRLLRLLDRHNVQRIQPRRQVATSLNASTRTATVRCRQRTERKEGKHKEQNVAKKQTDSGINATNVRGQHTKAGQGNKVRSHGRQATLTWYERMMACTDR